MKINRFMYVFVVAAIFLVSACGGTAPPQPAPVVQQPPPAPVEPVEPVQPPEPAPTVQSQPQYAPYCETAPSGCEAPTVKMLDNKYCVKKVPYAIMSVPAGTTYESLDEDLGCVDQLHSDGDLRITCHSVTSKQLWSYDIKVCNSTCSAPSLQTGTGQCPDDYGYDSTNNCCAVSSTEGEGGCITYTVDLGACPEPSS